MCFVAGRQLVRINLKVIEFCFFGWIRMFHRYHATGLLG